MSSRSVSTSPPPSNSPRGMVVVEGAATSLAFVVIVVFLRIWGRYRYNGSPGTTTSQLGEPRFWVMLSDLAIVLSFVVAVVLTVIACVGMNPRVVVPFEIC
ncbi:hypothetical protein CJF30_00003906 [Rutstroemia sp. NJR-2017a BBW]|nr:hypothetical protein CJF30_00003906 [Rutstroemia sp. NJR-2017a BBW]